MRLVVVHPLLEMPTMAVLVVVLFYFSFQTITCLQKTQLQQNQQRATSPSLSLLLLQTTIKVVEVSLEALRLLRIFYAFQFSSDFFCLAPLLARR